MAVTKENTCPGGWDDIDFITMLAEMRLIGSPVHPISQQNKYEKEKRHGKQNKENN